MSIEKWIDDFLTAGRRFSSALVRYGVFAGAAGGALYWALVLVVVMSDSGLPGYPIDRLFSGWLFTVPGGVLVGIASAAAAMGGRAIARSARSARSARTSRTSRRVEISALALGAFAGAVLAFYALWIPFHDQGSVGLWWVGPAVGVVTAVGAGVAMVRYPD
ncbi:MAG: hypothetical protein QOH55_140 [Microbacteriaceae bacterium]|nr:hypothetical protein [Microbacteriaceae bacterium]